MEALRTIRPAGNTTLFTLDPEEEDRKACERSHPSRFSRGRSLCAHGWAGGNKAVSAAQFQQELGCQGGHPVQAGNHLETEEVDQGTFSHPRRMRSTINHPDNHPDNHPSGEGEASSRQRRQVQRSSFGFQQKCFLELSVVTNTCVTTEVCRFGSKVKCFGHICDNRTSLAGRLIQGKWRQHPPLSSCERAGINSAAPLKCDVTPWFSCDSRITVQSGGRRYQESIYLSISSSALGTDGTNRSPLAR